MKNFLIGGVLLVVFLGGSLILVSKIGTPAPKQIACTMEAKLCPDGSSVGRTGPKCEFVDCPNAGNVKEAEATIAVLNQKILNNGVYITPLEMMGDSRCPLGVQCIWAGTVNLKVLLEREGGVQTATLTIGNPLTFAGKRVSLVGVTPRAHSGKTILPADYRFEFSVMDGALVSGGVLEGIMTIGPICPVERIDHPCLPTPEMFAARKIAIYRSDKKTLVTTITPNGQGLFSVSLAPGIYYVSMASQTGGASRVSGLPKMVPIKSSITVHLDISVDTGIR